MQKAPEVQKTGYLEPCCFVCEQAVEESLLQKCEACRCALYCSEDCRQKDLSSQTLSSHKVVCIPPQGKIVGAKDGEIADFIKVAMSQFIPEVIERINARRELINSYIEADEKLDEEMEDWKKQLDKVTTWMDYVKEAGLLCHIQRKFRKDECESSSFAGLEDFPYGTKRIKNFYKKVAELRKLSDLSKVVFCFVEPYDLMHDDVDATFRVYKFAFTPGKP